MWNKCKTNVKLQSGITSRVIASNVRGSTFYQPGNGMKFSSISKQIEYLYGELEEEHD